MGYSLISKERWGNINRNKYGDNYDRIFNHKKNTMTKILEFLQGKKTTIATILGAILVYILNQGYISAELAQLISVILIALGLGSNYATARMVAGCGKKK